MQVILFFKDQLLSMKWLESTIYRLLEFGLDEKAIDIIGFYLYDMIKILLIGLVFIITYIQSHFSPKKSKDIISKLGGIGGNIMAAIFGILTPFCSCSSILIFIGFITAGLPLGVTFSF